jgi:hypothetical protein
MPAISKSQQRLMGQVYGVRKWIDSDGKEGLDPKDIDTKYRDDIVQKAKDWGKKKSLKSYAKTKHKGLPEVKEGVETPSGNPGPVPTVYPYLNPESNKTKKKSQSAKMQNLADYREYISKIKK